MTPSKPETKKIFKKTEVITVSVIFLKASFSKSASKKKNKNPVKK
jgi:hypothetical protein